MLHASGCQCTVLNCELLWIQVGKETIMHIDPSTPSLSTKGKTTALAQRAKHGSESSSTVVKEEGHHPLGKKHQGLMLLPAHGPWIWQHLGGGGDFLQLQNLL